MKTLADFADPEGGYMLNDGHYGNATDLLHTGILGFCGCGHPDDNLDLILEYLDAITYKPDGVEVHKLSKPFYDAFCLVREFKLAAAAGSKRSQDFIGYVLDVLKLTEHGGSISGAWLTDKGHTFHALLREWKAQQTKPPETT